MCRQGRPGGRRANAVEALDALRALPCGARAARRARRARGRLGRRRRRPRRAAGARAARARRRRRGRHRRARGRSSAASRAHHERFGTATVDAGRMPRRRRSRAHRDATRRPARCPTSQPAALDEDLAPPRLHRQRDRMLDARASWSRRPARSRTSRRGVLRVLHERSFLDDPTRLWRARALRGAAGLRGRRAHERLAAEAVAGGALETVSGDRLGDELRAGAARARPARRAARRARPRPRCRGLELDPGVAGARAGAAAREGARRPGRARRRAVPGRALWPGWTSSGSPRASAHRCAAASSSRRCARRFASRGRRAGARRAASRRSRSPAPAASGAARWLDGAGATSSLEITGDDLLAAGIPEGPELGDAPAAGARAQARRRAAPAATPSWRCGRWNRLRRLMNLNVLQWDGGPGHYEVYYLTLTDPATRHRGCGSATTMRAPDDGDARVHACGSWRCTPTATRFGRKATLPIDRLVAEPRPVPAAQIGGRDAAPTAADARRVSRTSLGPALGAAAAGYEHVHPLLQRAKIAKTILVAAARRRRGPRHGHASAAATLDARRRPRRPGAPVGLQARRRAGRGRTATTSRRATARPRPDTFVDGVSVFVPRFGPRDRARARRSSARFARRGLRCRPGRSRVTRNPSRFGLTRWHFEAVDGKRRLVGEVDAPRARRSSASPTTTPTAREAYCYNSEVASMRLTVMRRRRRRDWTRAPAALVTDGRAHFEYAQREPVAGRRAADLNVSLEVDAAGRDGAVHDPRRRRLAGALRAR